MAGEQKRKARKTLVTKALMLGYNFEADPIGGYNLITPEGRTYRTFANWVDGVHGWAAPNYPALWVAAREALKLSGVPDAT